LRHFIGLSCHASIWPSLRSEPECSVGSEKTPFPNCKVIAADGLINSNEIASVDEIVALDEIANAYSYILEDAAWQPSCLHQDTL
jgi:hypothetical protein